MNPQREQLKALLNRKSQDPRSVTPNKPKPGDKRMSQVGKDENMIKFLKAQEDVPPPGLVQYTPNKQELAIFNAHNEKHKGNIDQRTRQIKDEEQREKELLQELSNIRAENNKYRDKIQELSQAVKNSTDGILQRKLVLQGTKLEFSRAQDLNLVLKTREKLKNEELSKLKEVNEGIMNEMLQMKTKINEQIERLSATDLLIKKKEQELALEREATEHLKEILKKSLSGKQVQEVEDDQTAKAALKPNAESLEEKITLEKFLAIMQAIKNEKEVVNRYRD